MSRETETERLWYKDAVIYELHVKTFFDANNDGYGDFQGLIQKLDYIQELGIDCIWLLPFYPSPLRDDGYDIADYRGIHPCYGNADDFGEFIRQAHQRRIKIITELVVNHTSDSHAWFQAARHAPADSPQRRFYVWSETGKEFSGARIIFTDSESSNWRWDPQAGAFYWHRFFHHQPDLNFDNPQVCKAIVDVMRYWLDQGVDGLRLDAIPYLFERDGTNCENLPETHDLLKQWRQVVDKDYPGRVFLAEANQWPQDVVAYFGDGDECHMAYHFPIMPRLYMALDKEDTRPITDIMAKTPAIPESCQWAMFLRNHDELTLEMVTDEERAYMYRAFAPHPRMRINVGIRRRLAPLLQFSRAKIQLLNALLFSLPGTPIVYYGDEIGMGDNIFLNDRDGVRTPMQWSEARNGGFSAAPQDGLYLPPIMDPVAGYHSVNVERQAMDPSSLLNWMKKIIHLRRRHKVFGRGSMRFIETHNRSVLAYLREYQKETVLVVANLSSAAEAISIDISQCKGAGPIDMFGQASFPVIGNSDYTLTLAGHSFYWLKL